jgi:hypothetical protein
MRDSTSRPDWSVPSQCTADGPSSGAATISRGPKGTSVQTAQSPRSGSNSDLKSKVARRKGRRFWMTREVPGMWWRVSITAGA